MKVFVVVRDDLPAGAQLAQSCHALRLFGAEHPEVDAAWYAGSNNLVCLQVPGLAALLALGRRAASREIPCSTFREPDFGGAATALALGPSGARLVSSLPLALRPKRGSLPGERGSNTGESPRVGSA